MSLVNGSSWQSFKQRFNFLENCIGHSNTRSAGVWRSCRPIALSVLSISPDRISLPPAPACLMAVQRVYRSPSVVRAGCILRNVELISTYENFPCAAEASPVQECVYCTSQVHVAAYFRIPHLRSPRSYWPNQMVLPVSSVNCRGGESPASRTSVVRECIRPSTADFRPVWRLDPSAARASSLALDCTNNRDGRPTGRRSLFFNGCSS